jgi:hypothetical protein
VAELTALLELLGVDLPHSLTHSLTHTPSLASHSPYLKLSLPSERVAQQLCERSVLVKHVYRILGGAQSLTHSLPHCLTASLIHSLT